MTPESIREYVRRNQGINDIDRAMLLGSADEIERLQALTIRTGDGLIVTQGRFNACLSQIERLQQDAKRYRNLRIIGCKDMSIQPDEFDKSADAAIDAAMEAK